MTFYAVYQIRSNKYTLVALFVKKGEAEKFAEECIKGNFTDYRIEETTAWGVGLLDLSP